MRAARVRFPFRMGFSDWISLLALMIACGASALEVRRWFESGPRLRLRIIADVVMVPGDDKRSKAGLWVTNRGAAPTTITHMVVYIYRSPWHRWRHKTEMEGIVNSPNIPSEIGTNRTWFGLLYYSEDLAEARRKGRLYTGVIASHSNRTFLIRIPTAKSPEIPTKQVA